MSCGRRFSSLMETSTTRHALTLPHSPISPCRLRRRNPPEASEPGGGFRVLFIGNSLTASNDLAGTVAHLAASVNDTVAAEAVTRPNFAVIDHVNGMSDAVDLVRRGGWDFVVLQQGPTSQQLGRDTLILAAELLDPDVRAGGGRIAQLMVWAAAPDRAVFDGVLQSCLETARAIDGDCFPAGEAWRAAWSVDPALPLYGPDGFHPAPLGTYLAALVVTKGSPGTARGCSAEGGGAGANPAGGRRHRHPAPAHCSRDGAQNQRADGPMTGRLLSMADRFFSSQGGSLSSCPSAASGSSTENPGATVAASNSTPPGSRK